jgi:hypothetical protein
MIATATRRNRLSKPSLPVEVPKPVRQRKKPVRWSPEDKAKIVKQTVETFLDHPEWNWDHCFHHA